MIIYYINNILKPSHFVGEDHTSNANHIKTLNSAIPLSFT